MNNSKCDYCAKQALCHTVIIVLGLHGYQERQICSRCESAEKHKSDLDQARFNELMKADLDGYPNDPE